MDNSQRPTKELTTTSGFKVVVKTYATGREVNDIQQVFLETAKVSVVGNVPKIDGFDPKAEQRAISKMIALLVESVNGNATSVADLVLDLPAADYEEVVSYLNEITGKKKPSATSSQ